MCMRPMHHLGGAYAGAGLAWAQHQPWWVIAASAAIAAAAAPGPDVDQRRWWRTLDRWVPDEWLGWGGPLQHRGITHWWGIPAAGALAVMAFTPGLWVAWAILAGWASHLALDFIFGKASPFGRGAGIPLMPWWRYVGVGLDAGGRVENWLLKPLLLVVGPGVFVLHIL